MKKNILVLFLFIIKISFSQTRSVQSYQKINDLNGGFTGGLNNSDGFGVSIDNLGDLDGNGVNDLVVGAFTDDDGGTNRGAVWVLFLDSNDGVISHTKISDTNGDFKGVLNDNDLFGGAVSYLGDLNKDGFVEIAVGADYDGDGGYWHGAVWVLSLNTDGTVKASSKISDTEGGFNGNINGDAIFGTDIENIGDLDGDGVDDLAVGSRRDNDGGGNEGAIWVLFMNTDFSVKNYTKINETQGGFSENLDYEDYFGGSVANIGDLNKDGVNDLVVGAYRDDELYADSGSFYVLFMKKDGTVESSQKISNISGNLNTSISYEALFGESIDGVADIDGDGKVEIVIGAMKQVNSTLSVRTGGFFIVELNEDGTISEDYFYTYAENCFSGKLDSGDLFGGSVSFLSTDPANVKIAVGAYGDSENGFKKGAVWILNLGETVFAIASQNNPTACNLEDGTITISGLTNNSSYTITYLKDTLSESKNLISTASGTIEITGLSSGVYDNIVVREDSSGCSDTLDKVELTSPGLSASLASVNPTACNLEDGIITISGLTNNSSYTVTYLKDTLSESKSLISTVSGTIEITGLSSGVYDNIVVSEDSSGCFINLNLIELRCFHEDSLCFKAKSFFTPNNDGSNDTWTLELFSNSCDYKVYIYDRYGQLLKTLTPQNNAWNGMYKGLKVPSNDYWYVVKYSFGKTRGQYRSHFTLKR